MTNNLLLKNNAIRLAHPNVVAVDLANWECFDVNNNIVNVDDVLVQEKLNELQAAEPLKLLREERNRLISLTDWRFRSDLSPSQAWIDYSQALRDLPATASPSLDENGNLTGVTWPTPPSE